MTTDKQSIQNVTGTAKPVTITYIGVKCLVRLGRRRDEQWIQRNPHWLPGRSHGGGSVVRGRRGRRRVGRHNDLLLLLLLLHRLLRHRGRGIRLLRRRHRRGAEGHGVESVHAVAVLRGRHHPDWRKWILDNHQKSENSWVMVWGG